MWEPERGRADGSVGGGPVAGGIVSDAAVKERLHAGEALIRIFLKKKRVPDFLLKFMGVFLYSAILMSVFIYIFFRAEYDEKQRLTKFYGNVFAERISKQLYELSLDVMPLYTLVILNKGDSAGFTTTAQKILLSRPEIIVLNLAKDGIVSHIFPYEGNQKSMGHNLIKDDARKEEALLAKETQKMTVSGPFHLLQGGVGLAFRQPIYLPSPDTKKELFWGFAIVIYRFPEVLKRGVNFNILSNAGFDWELWRKDPASGKKLSLLSSGAIPEDFNRFQINLQNATWWMDIAPATGFINVNKLIVAIVLSIVFCIILSLLFTYFVNVLNNYKKIKAEMNVDDLTGLFNKRYFWKKFESALERHLSYSYGASEARLFLCVVDINKFKEINDTYGHLAGDKILIEFSKRLIAELSFNEFASRFGGDEFVAVFYCHPQGGEMPDRLQNIKRRLEDVYHINGRELDVTVSLGALSPEKDMLSEKQPGVSAGEFFLEKVDKLMYSEKYSFHVREKGV